MIALKVVFKCMERKNELDGEGPITEGILLNFVGGAGIVVRDDDGVFYFVHPDHIVSTQWVTLEAEAKPEPFSWPKDAVEDGKPLV